MDALASSHRVAKLETTLGQLKAGLKTCTPENGHDRVDRDWYRSAIEQYEREIQWEHQHGAREENRHQDVIAGVGCG